MQRFGRINRRCLQADLAPVHVFCEPNDGQKIYDAALVQRTLEILEREDGKPIDESAIGSWLDEIYSGEIADRWHEDFVRAGVEFEATCIRPLRAFQADPTLEDLFYKAFESIEVLPETLYEEYMKLKEDDPIRAGELLVPITLGRYHVLANKGQMLPRNREIPHVVLANYNSELGLTFDLNVGKTSKWASDENSW